MRILISTWSLQVGGGEILAMNLAAELARRGHAVYVFNQRAELIDHDLVKRLLPAGVKVLSMLDRPQRSFWSYKINALQQRLGMVPGFYQQQQQAYLAACLRRYRVDVVSSHATYSDALSLPVAQKAGIPLVITEHGEYNHFLATGRRDFVGVLRGAAKVVAVSDYCRVNLTQAFPGLPSMQTIYNGVITNATYTAAAMRGQLGLPADAFVVGMVARGRADKGWQQAIDAFRRLSQQPRLRPLRLVLVGGSEYLDELAHTYAAEPDIIFAGRVPNPDFYIAGFDVGLLPTYFPAEALPLVLIEYMSYGLPSIATGVGGIPELLASAVGPTGQLISLDPVTQQPRPDELFQALERYYLEPAVYNEHAANASRASQHYTMGSCTDQYEELFERTIAKQ
ncbi:glycosyltransferase family 4 protein [Hymenobacter actinosclerus]|uniref:Glycosyltransferase involved in cell wall bisynthesis n=1 Tax=Hymenobacter actinosclerus TaxID=82805 RepID=A0A1I0GWR9_9BACT|nr:glycosyltransferase family 4 protein [Hymenobacter actinosclerus]SET75687.1 Glycosyltransferase involved in cell wall bisynthesis [Hymenobacter actinosclerus]